MYNTDFVVRYHEIENELIMNLHRKFMKKQEEEERIEREEKSAASKAAAAKVVAAVVAILNFEKEKEKEKEKELEKEKEQIIPVKNKGGRKKAAATATSVTATSVTATATATNVTEEPKKRGRKKAVVNEPIVNEPIVNEPIVNEPIKISITIEPVKLEHKEKVDKNPEDGDVDDDDDGEDLEYSMDDVHLICEKLYRDELLSVFNVETINDENMDAGIKKAIEKMIDNAKFKQILEEIKQELMDLSNPTGTPEEIENIRRNLEYLIFITLFSQQVFYITHKCICQLFTVDDVHPDLLDRLKEKTIGLFKKN